MHNNRLNDQERELITSQIVAIYTHYTCWMLWLFKANPRQSNKFIQKKTQQHFVAFASWLNICYLLHLFFSLPSSLFNSFFDLMSFHILNQVVWNRIGALSDKYSTLYYMFDAIFIRKIPKLSFYRNRNEIEAVFLA